MCEKQLPEWKFTRDNYSIVWQGPKTMHLYYPMDDDEEDESFPFIGNVVDQSIVCACWDNKNSKDMGLVPAMINVHITICKQIHNYSVSRGLITEGNFSILIDNILRNQLLSFGETVTSPRYVKAINIKIAIPNDNIPIINARYIDQDGDPWDFEELAIDEIRKDEAHRMAKYLVDLAGDINAIRKIRNIIPGMDGYWKDYVQEEYPDVYDPFEKKLLETMRHIKEDAAVSAEPAKPKTSREKLKSIYNNDILNMVVEGMIIRDKEIDKFSDSECDIVAESLGNATCKDIYESGSISASNREVTLVCDETPGKEKAKPTHDEDCTPPEDSEKSSREFEEAKIAHLLKKETESNPCFNFKNYKPGNSVPGWALDNSKEGFAQVKPEYKDLFDKK